MKFKKLGFFPAFYFFGFEFFIFQNEHFCSLPDFIFQNEKIFFFQTSFFKIVTL